MSYHKSAYQGFWAVIADSRCFAAIGRYWRQFNRTWAASIVFWKPWRIKNTRCSGWSREIVKNQVFVASGISVIGSKTTWYQPHFVMRVRIRICVTLVDSRNFAVQSRLINSGLRKNERPGRRNRNGVMEQRSLLFVCQAAFIRMIVARDWTRLAFQVMKII